MTPEMICCGDARTPSWHNHEKCWPQGPCQQGLSSPSQQWVVPVLGSETAVAQYRPDAPTPADQVFVSIDIVGRPWIVLLHEPYL